MSASSSSHRSTSTASSAGYSTDTYSEEEGEQQQPPSLTPSPPVEPNYRKNVAAEHEKQDEEEEEVVWDERMKYDEEYLKKVVPADVFKKERIAARKQARKQILEEAAREEEKKALMLQEDHESAPRFSEDELGVISEVQKSLEPLEGEDKQFITCVKAVFLSQCAYRVPTGTEFWDIITNIKEGRSRVSVAEAFRKYQKKSLAAKDVVQGYLKNVSLCIGVEFVPFAHTSLSVELSDVQELLTTTEEGDEDDDEPGADLSNIEAPKIAPGWLISKEGESNIWVSVAGTQNPDDSFRDCMFIPTPFEVPLPDDEVKSRYLEVVKGKKVMVHHGFLDGAVKVFEQVKERVLESLGPDSERVTVNLTGHSLGGATALLLAIFFSAWNNRSIKLGKVFTFGAPNLFYFEDDSAAEPVQLLLSRFKLYSFINHRDIVPRALGAPLIKKLAKLLIKVGVKALQNLTPENAAYLLKYRNVAGRIYYMTPPYNIVTVEDTTEQQKVLNFGVLDCRPAAGTHHKIGNYISRMLDRLRELSSNPHTWSADDGAGSVEELHPTAAIVYDKKDPTVLAGSFLGTLGEIFNELKSEEDVFDRAAFAKLLTWSGKTYPMYMVDKMLCCGKYETDGDGLTKDGFIAVMEDFCSSDLPWVGRVVEVMGKKPQDRGEVDVAKFPNGEKILEEDEGVLSAEAVCVVGKIFRKFCKGELWYDCLRTFLTVVEKGETGVEPVASHIATSAKALLAELNNATPSSPTTCTSSFDLATPSNSYITESDFTELFRRWAVDDEHRVWQMFSLFGAAMNLQCDDLPSIHNDGMEGNTECLCNNNISEPTPEPPVILDDGREKTRILSKNIMLKALNDYVIGEEERQRQEKQAERQEKRKKRKPTLPRMYHDYIPSVHAVVAAPSAASIKRNPEKAFATATATNIELEKQTKNLRRKLQKLESNPNATMNSSTMATTTTTAAATTTTGPPATTEERWEALNSKLQRENSILKQKVSQTPGFSDTNDVIDGYAGELKVKEKELAKLRRVNRELLRTSKTRGDVIITKDDAEQRVRSEKINNEKELVFLRRQLEKTKGEDVRLRRFQERQEDELNRLPSEGVPVIDVKLLQKIMGEHEEMDAQINDRRKELSITKHALTTELKKMSRLNAEQAQHIASLQAGLDNLTSVLEGKEEQLASNTRATSAGRVLQQGRLRPVKPASP